MPIATCLIKDKKVPVKTLGTMVNEWSKLIGISERDICINIQNNFIQVGHKYTALIILYLPTLWGENDVKTIQSSLVKVISKYFNIKVKEIFLMTTKIESNNVVENGELIKW